MSARPYFKAKAAVEAAAADLRHALAAETAAREAQGVELLERSDAETEARRVNVASLQEDILQETQARDEAVASLLSALEESAVAAALELECARVDAEEFSVGQVDAWRAVGPGMYCDRSPRHRMPSNSRNDGSRCVSMTWRAMCGCP